MERKQGKVGERKSETEMPDGRKEMDVAAFRVIPTPISTEELHRLRLRLPDNQDPADFVRNLRADIG